MPKTRPVLHEPDGASRGSSVKRPAPTHPHGRRFSQEELSRHEREVRATRMIFMGMGAFIVLVIAILAYGWYREYVAAYSEPVASVSGQNISIDNFAKRLDYNRKQLESQVSSMQQVLQQIGTDQGMQQLADMYKQQIQQAQFSESRLADQTLEQMIQEQLIRQEAAKRGITVSGDEVDKELATIFGDPTPAPTAAAAAAQQTPATNATPAAAPADATQPAATPAATSTSSAAAGPTSAATSGGAANATPAPTADVQARVANFATQYGFTTNDVRSLVESQLLSQKLQEAMGNEVPTTAEEVHARHILVDSEDKAKAIVEQLKNGAKFEDLAKSESTDPGSKENGGDLGWFPKGTMVQAFDDAAFKLDVDQISDPVQTSYGWHVIQVLEKDPNRKLDDQQLSQAKSNAYTKWVTAASQGSDVKRFLSDSQKSWVYRQIKWSPQSPLS